MDQDLKDMLKISHGVGRNPRLVQGGGGNTSVKTDGGRLMYVKASGTSLAEMRQGQGYRLVDVEKCAAIVQDEALKSLPPAKREEAVLERLMQACRDSLEGRPSVEASLHAMLDRCVVHTHPSVVNGLLCARQGREAIARLFADLQPPPLYIEYCGAGFSLAVRMRAALQEYHSAHGRLPEVVFLENHGLFVTSADADHTLALTESIFQTIELAARQAYQKAAWPSFHPPGPAIERMVVEEVAAAARRFYTGLFGRTALVCFVSNEIVMDFLRLPQAAELCHVNPLTPDQVVYCKDRPLWLPFAAERTAIRERLASVLAEAESGENTALCLVAENVGLFCAAPSWKFLGAVQSTMVAALETLTVAAHFGGPRGLDDAAIRFLREWEVERFRTTVAHGRRAEHDLDGKVAIVTGAGSGLGRGISLTLAAKGCNVILADIDLDAARETERLIAGQAVGRGFPLKVDVTREQEVQDALHQALRLLGGVDILVNCAGIAPAGPLQDFSLQSWQKALDVNLTGYFLMAREAARCMIRQGTGGNIINISSKSGLEPSKHNTAYNATKAGQIHMARGWALDLAEHGIRVNVVCPGNVFRGSKIWNEEYIQAIAAKRGLKPEEVIPYYVGLTALKKEITWEDIGEAVAFLASSRADKITGQTLVVDGGQVFVR